MRKTALGLSLFMVASACTLYAQEWENVGSSATVSAGGSSYNNLAIDNDGNYFLSYYDVSVGKGSVQKFDGTAWSYVGGAAGITEGMATFNSLSVDGEGTVYYTHQKGWPASGMGVLKFDGTEWASLTDAETSTINYHASAVSQDNVLYVFSGISSGTVKKLVDGSWVQVGTTGFSGGATFAEMVIDSDNNVYVSVINSGSASVYKNSATAGSDVAWELLGGAGAGSASGGEQYTSDIALDADDNVYVAYVSNAAGGRKANVKKYNGTEWVSVGTENFTDESVQHLALAVSPEGKPYVVSSRWGDDDFLYNSVHSYNEATDEWVTLGGAYVNSGESKFNDIIFDPIEGYVVIAYSASGGTQVKRLVAESDPPVVITVDSVVISVMDDLEPQISEYGGTLALSAQVFPLELDQSVSWSISSGEALAEVSEEGVVTAIADGTVTIRATSVEEPEIYDEIEIVITNQTILEVDSVVVTTIGGVPALINSPAGTLSLTAAVYPAEIDQSVVWTLTEGGGYASISDEGVLSALADGLVTVRATSVENEEIFGELEVTITNQTPSSADKINVRKVTIYPNPTNGPVFIEKILDIESIAVHNMLGQKVLEADPARIDLGALSPGAYLLHIYDIDGGLTVVKVLKN